MSKEYYKIEDEELRDEIYSELVRLYALWRGEGLNIFSTLEAQADNISARIRRKYDVKPRYTRREDYMLLPAGESPPFCKGCFNEYGGCGTPCTSCNKIEMFNNQWNEILGTPDYTVLKRNNK